MGTVYRQRSNIDVLEHVSGGVHVEGREPRRCGRETEPDDSAAHEREDGDEPAQRFKNPS
jgi:hypothetical protein